MREHGVQLVANLEDVVLPGLDRCDYPGYFGPGSRITHHRRLLPGRDNATGGRALASHQPSLDRSDLHFQYNAFAAAVAVVPVEEGATKVHACRHPERSWTGVAG
jgi:hypothetical protein